MSKTKPTLTDQLRQYIETADVSRYRLSQQTGISQSLLSRFMHGKAFFSADSLNTLADALDLKLTKTTPPNGK